MIRKLTGHQLIDPGGAHGKVLGIGVVDNNCCRGLLGYQLVSRGQRHSQFAFNRKQIEDETWEQKISSEEWELISDIELREYEIL